MSTAVDLDYCLILIDKLISPNVPPPDMKKCLIRELKEAVKHQEMKDLIQGLADQDLSLEEKNNMKERFMQFDHEGTNDNDPTEINYKELLDKLLDPKLPEPEYKPTLKALLEGDLEQEKKNMISSIINCQNKDQKANMVKRFKSLFDREKDEAERAKREKMENKAARKAARAKMEENLLKFEDDGMTLIEKLLDSKIPVHMKSKVYERLMEQDIHAEMKNLAIKLLESENASKKLELLEDFKKEREVEKKEAARRKAQEEKQKAEEETKRKLVKQQLYELKKKKLQKENRVKEIRKDERLNAVAGPSNAKVVERGTIEDRLRLEEETKRKKQQRQQMKEQKHERNRDIRKDHKLNAVPGLSNGKVLERGAREAGLNWKQPQQQREREERKQKLQNKIREKEIRKNERLNAVPGPSDGKVVERGPKEDELSLEEEIKRKKLRKQQKELKEEKKPRKNTDEDTRKDEKLCAVPVPSNPKVVEREDSPSWEVWTFDPVCLNDFQVFIPDLQSSLDPSQQEQFKRGFDALEKSSKTEDKKNLKKLKFLEGDGDDESPELKKVREV